MSLGFQSFMAVLPILTAAILLVGFRWPAKWAMPICYVVAVLISFLFWQVDVIRVIASTIQGLFITADILFIIFGCHSAPQYSQAFRGHQCHPHRLHQNQPGSSGASGTHGMVVRCLHRRGFGIRHSSGHRGATDGGHRISGIGRGHDRDDDPEHPVTFGAVGTPILIGVKGGLENPQLTALLAQVGMDFSQYLQMITAASAILHAIAGTLIPTFMVVMMTRFFGKNKSWTEGLSILPFSIMGRPCLHHSLHVDRHLSRP